MNTEGVQPMANDAEARREELLRGGMADDRVAAAIGTFNALSGLLGPPRTVSTTEVTFGTTTNT
jgi:hypothetical protein